MDKYLVRNNNYDYYLSMTLKAVFVVTVKFAT